MNASENHDPNAIQMVSFTEWIWDAWKEGALKPLRFPSFFASVLRPSIKSSSPAMWKHCSAWLTVEPIQAVGFASSSSWTRFVSFSHILVIIMNYNELNPYGERYPQRCGEVSTKDPYKFFNVVHQNVSVPSLVFSRWDLLGIFATSGDRKPQTYFFRSIWWWKCRECLTMLVLPYFPVLQFACVEKWAFGGLLTRDKDSGTALGALLHLTRRTHMACFFTLDSHLKKRK